MFKIFDIFDQFHGTPVFRFFAVALFAFCFVEMVRRCVVHSKETREGKMEAKREALRESEGLGSENWEREE